MEAKRNYSAAQIANLREISDSFWANSGNVTDKIVTKEFFFQVFFALILSIPTIDFFENWAKYSKKPENTPKKAKKDPENVESGGEGDEEEGENEEKELKNLYFQLTKVSDKGTKSKLLLQRTEAKSRYYEECYQLRLIIQNAQFDFCGLGATTATFLQGREITKIQKQQIKEFGIGPEKCRNCGTKWLQERDGKCLRCEKDNSIQFFISLCCYFQVLGDCERFWSFLDPQTHNIIADHGDHIRAFFKKSQNKTKNDYWNGLRKEYGEKQLKLIRKEGVEKIAEKPDFKEFNCKYGLALTGEEKELDLSEAKNARKEEFCEDLSLLEFPFVEKLIFPRRKIDINAFKPNMPRLKILEANECEIKQIELDPEYFWNLYRISLKGNKIESFTDFRNLTRIPSLKFIDLHDNPFEYTEEIKDTRRLLFSSYKIELRYSIELMYKTKEQRIEEESDEEIKELIAAKDEENESELSQSAKESLLKK